MLALHVGEEVRAASLEEWLTLSPGAVRTSISRLRRVIGADAGGTTALGYRLRGAVDAAAFERLVSLAPDLGDVAARAALEEAIRLWRRRTALEFAGEPWAEPAARRWCELHASAVEDLAVLQLDAGEVSSALVAVQALVDREPFRERSHALLMRALAQGGRSTEALRAFHTYRRLVCEEIGTEPSGALVELDRDRRIDRVEHPGRPAARRARMEPGAAERPDRRAPPRSAGPGELVRRRRRQDLATVLDLVRSHRLVTLTGSGGCGKTRLAIAAAAEAERHGTSVRWVELGVVPVAGDVVEQVAAAIGLTLQPHGDATLQLIAHVAAGRPMLLVLDNAEHVLSSVTGLLTELLPRRPSLRVLVTSREPLGIAGESVWRVRSPLATPPPGATVGADELPSFDALQLFVERAREARPGFVVDADVIGHVTTICTGVDGLPLAVELAAARTRTLPVEVVAAGITDALRWQAAGTRAPLGRHATLHASIAWSVDLVEPLARSVLIRLAVFQSSFTLESALAVGGDGEPTRELADAVGALVDASLLQFDDVTGRFRMLHTVRRFCTLRAHEELERARARHAHHLAAFCADVGAGRRGIERGRFIREMPDLVAAMEWARTHEPRLVFAMCAGLAPVRSALGHHGNVAETWTWLVSLDRSAGPRSDGGSAALERGVGDGRRRPDGRSDGTPCRRERGGRRGRPRASPPMPSVPAGGCARGGAMLPAYQGRLAPILAHVEEARGRHDDLEDSIYGGFAAYMLALTGRVDEADRHVRELERLTRRHDTAFRVDTVGNGYAAAILVDLIRGDLQAAAERGDQPVPDDPAFSMTAAAAVAHVALVTGDRRTFVRAVEWSRQRTIPVLRFLPTFIELVERRLDGVRDHAADLAERFWEEAVPVPVSRVHPLPLLTSVLVEAGRVGQAQAMTEEAASLVAEMEPAPLLSAGVLASPGAPGGTSRIGVGSGGVPRRVAGDRDDAWVRASDGRGARAGRRAGGRSGPGGDVVRCGRRRATTDRCEWSHVDRWRPAARRLDAVRRRGRARSEVAGDGRVSCGAC